MIVAIPVYVATPRDIPAALVKRISTVDNNTSATITTNDVILEIEAGTKARVPAIYQEGCPNFLITIWHTICWR